MKLIMRDEGGGEDRILNSRASFHYLFVSWPIKVGGQMQERPRYSGE